MIHRMKKLPFALILLSLWLTACNRPGVKIQQELAGTWVVDLGGNLRSTDVIQPNGSYECQITSDAHGRTATIGGILLVRGDSLIDTVIRHQSTNLLTPTIFHGHVLHIDDREFIAQWDGLTNATVARKVEP
jgi:hypothetical protein